MHLVHYSTAAACYTDLADPTVDWIGMQHVAAAAKMAQPRSAAAPYCMEKHNGCY